MKKIASLLLSFLILLSQTVNVFAAPPKVNVGSYLIIDGLNGRILESKYPDKKRYPASTTKIMTAIIALEKGNLNQVMTASPEAIVDVGYDGSNAGIKPGEKLSLDVLLNALLICSANEAANVIAENICSTRSEFVELMNKKAKKLGATGTRFVNPNGVYDPNHYTTARDMAIITEHAMKIPKFREIVQKKQYELPVSNKHKKIRMIYTTNSLLFYNNKDFDVCGIKTGYTSQSGNNLIAAANGKDGMVLYAVLLKSQLGVFDNCDALFEYAFKKYSLQTLFDTETLVDTISVSDAPFGKKIKIYTQAPIKCALPKNSTNLNIVNKTTYNNNVRAPLKKGDVVGEIEYYLDGKPISSVNLITGEYIEKGLIANIRDFFISVYKNTIVRIYIIILLAFLILRFTLRRISRTLNAKKKKQ